MYYVYLSVSKTEILKKIKKKKSLKIGENYIGKEKEEN